MAAGAKEAAADVAVAEVERAAWTLKDLLDVARQEQVLAQGRDLLDGQRELMKQLQEMKAQGTQTLSPEARRTLDELDATLSRMEEELARLRSHCDQFVDLMQSTGPTHGRKLDFLLQEMAREVNTIGSKISDADITRLVVEMKADVERMREQVQNIL